jgi:outer membrane lipoprotein-sorting protein
MSMSAHQSSSSPGDGDILDRATAALRNTPEAADGPSAETLSRTLAALDAAAGSYHSTRIFRRKTMFTVLKLAASIVVAAGGLFYLGGPHLAGAPVSFEEVAQKLQNAHSFAYHMTMEIPGAQAPVTMQLRFKEPGLVRTERVSGGGPIIVFSRQAGKRLILDPGTKTAVLMEGYLPGEARGNAHDEAVSGVQSFRTLAEKNGKPAGEKLIGKTKVQGFRVQEATGQELFIWVDPETRSPIQVEISGKFGGGQTYRSLISEFELDPKLDDSLFSLDPPQGYKLNTQNLSLVEDNDAGTPEDAIVKLLRMYAEKSAGSFPGKIDDWVAYGEKFKDEKIQGPTDPKMMKLINIVVRVQLLLLESKGKYVYRPDGIKLGDADKMLFWYQAKGKETYRAVFGDLHIADVTADQLPQKPTP